MHKIIIEPTVIRGERGQRYRVWHEGAVLIEDTWNPEFEACRALLAKGIRGRFETWRRNGQHACMRGDIEKAAGLTVLETETAGPRIVRWTPLPADAFSDAVSDGAGRARTAELQSAGREIAAASNGRWLGRVIQHD